MRIAQELRDRTKQFASRTIHFYVALPSQRKGVEVLGHQLLRSGTSVAAHIREASRARSEAEFCSKMEGALQEADESELWLELLRDDCKVATENLEELISEADQLMAIFVTIIGKTRRRDG